MHKYSDSTVAYEFGKGDLIIQKQSGTFIIIFAQ